MMFQNTFKGIQNNMSLFTTKPEITIEFQVTFTIEKHIKHLKIT